MSRTRKVMSPPVKSKRLTAAQKKRSEAAKKAAATRKANAERKKLQQQPVAVESNEPATVEPTVESTNFSTEIDDALAAEVQQLDEQQRATLQENSDDSEGDDKGQPATQPMAVNQSQKMLKENLKPLMATGFAVLSIKVGEEWAISEPELNLLAEAAANVAAMYLPTKASDSPWLGLSMVAAGITVPRAMVTLMKPKKQPVAANEEEGKQEQEAA